jgi:pyrrolidone-carboxylate peptidase
MKVLVTAFKPFNKSKNNYSMEVLKYIDGVDKLIIDVIYDGCYEEIMHNYDLNIYDFVIALGEARMRDELTVESQALNISSCSIPDNSGILKQNEVIFKDSPEVLQSKVCLYEIAKVATISNYAGKFVCNNLYYHLLHEYPTKSLFIHIPNCYDDESEYAKYANMITKIINVLYSQK